MEGLIKRDNVWAKKARELYRIRQLRINYEKIEKELSHEFKILNNDANSIGGGYKFTISVRPGPINYKLIPELKNLDFSQYRSDDVKIWKLEFIGEEAEKELR